MKECMSCNCLKEDKGMSFVVALGGILLCVNCYCKHLEECIQDTKNKAKAEEEVRREKKRIKRRKGKIGKEEIVESKIIRTENKVIIGYLV